MKIKKFLFKNFNSILSSNHALSPVIATILVIGIVVSTTSMVMLWGIPFLENMKAKTEVENMYAQMDLLDNSLQDLIHEGVGASSENEIDLESGSISYEKNKNRMIVYYSLEEGVDFNVTGFYDGDNSSFFLEDYEDDDIQSAEIYWLGLPDPVKEINSCEDVVFNIDGGTVFYQKFDISGVPEGAVIDRAYLKYYVFDYDMGWDGSVCYSHIVDQFWDETCSYEELGSLVVSDTFCDGSVMVGDDGLVKSVDVDKFFLNDFSVGNIFCSVKLSFPSVVDFVLDDVDFGSVLVVHYHFPNDFDSGVDGDVGIEVVNRQSYPSLFGNWTVYFSVDGSADLRVTPVDGTSWNLDGSVGSELQFLDLDCGSDVDFCWVDGSLVVEGFSCDGVCSLTCRVLDPGKHSLEFVFGDCVVYAYNDVTLSTPYDFKDKPDNCVAYYNIDHGTRTPLPPIVDSSGDDGESRWIQLLRLDCDEKTNCIKNIYDDDENKNTWSAATNTWVNLLYEFTIEEDINKITGLEITWNGYDAIAKLEYTFNMSIWNEARKCWITCYRYPSDSGSVEPATSDYNATYTFSDEFIESRTEYINDTNGKLRVAISGAYNDGSGGYTVHDGIAGGSEGDIYEDYVKLEVFYTYETPEPDCVDAPTASISSIPDPVDGYTIYDKNVTITWSGTDNCPPYKALQHKWWLYDKETGLNVYSSDNDCKLDTDGDGWCNDELGDSKTFNLPYGTYIFSVIVKDNDDRTSIQEYSDDIVIQQPWSPTIFEEIDEYKNKITIDDSDDEKIFHDAVLINLYNNADTLVGSIWLFDLSALKYSITTQTGSYDLFSENGGIVYYEQNNKYGYLKKDMSAYEENGIFSIRIIQLLSESGYSQSGGGNQWIYSRLLQNTLREDNYVYMLKMQVFGENDDEWFNYFDKYFEFDSPKEFDGDSYVNYSIGPDTNNRIKLQLSHSIIKMSWS